MGPVDPLIVCGVSYYDTHVKKMKKYNDGMFCLNYHSIAIGSHIETKQTAIHRKELKLLKDIKFLQYLSKISSVHCFEL